MCADEEFVLRNRIVGKESNYLENLQPHIDALRLDVIVIQFNYGFFNHRELSAFIRRQHDAGRSVVMTMHSNCGSAGKEPSWNFRLAEMKRGAGTLRPVVGAFDCRYGTAFEDLGLTANVALFPHGVINYSAASVTRQQQSLPLIASYGFCLPHRA